jgi:hypothetical protein
LGKKAKLAKEQERKAAAEPPKPKAETPKVMEVTEEEAQEIAAVPAAPTTTASDLPAPEEGKGEEEEKKDEGPAPVGNGGTTDKYVWTQTLGEVVMNIRVPIDTTGKQCKVVMSSSHLKVDVKGETVIDGDFPKKAKPDDLVWTLETNEGVKDLAITFDKFDTMGWWDCVIDGDAKIDT